jgi:hypothetical protein
VGRRRGSKLLDNEATAVSLALVLKGSSVFAWYLLVTATPQLACTRIPKLRQQAAIAVDSIENVLKSLSSKIPSAANNLRNFRILRKALHDSHHRQVDQAQTVGFATPCFWLLAAPATHNLRNGSPQGLPYRQILAYISQSTFEACYIFCADFERGACYSRSTK